MTKVAGKTQMPWWFPYHWARACYRLNPTEKNRARLIAEKRIYEQKLSEILSRNEK